jgi:hemolysin activation/secretion protein
MPYGVWGFLQCSLSDLTKSDIPECLFTTAANTLKRMTLKAPYSRLLSSSLCAMLLSANISVVQSQPTVSPSERPNPTDEQRRQQERQAEQNAKLQAPVERSTERKVNLNEENPANNKNAVNPAGSDKTPSKITHILKDETPCFPIKQIELTGEQLEGFAWLLNTVDTPSDAGKNPASANSNTSRPPTTARLSSYTESLDKPVGQCLGAKGINVVLKRAQDALIEKGFVTSRVLTQPQDISTGILVISLVPGRIRDIRFDSSVPNDIRTQLGNAIPTQAGEILNLRDLEQALENLKRLPNAEADFKIVPAAAPNESDIIITYTLGKVLRGNVTMDDSGGRSTGKLSSSATISIDNLFGLSDLFYLTRTRNLGGTLADKWGGTEAGDRGTDGYTAHYSVPLGYWQLAATANRNQYHQTVFGAFQDYQYRGKSSGTEAKLSYLAYRDSTKKITPSIKAFQKTSNNFIDDTEVEVQRRKTAGWEAALNYKESFASLYEGDTFKIGQTTVDATLTYKRGTGAWGALHAPEELFNEGTSRFKIYTADASLTAPWATRDASGASSGGLGLKYSATWRAQWQRSPLVAQDRFSIGSRYTVRGFENGLSAERGWMVKQELSTQLPKVWDIANELYIGVDYGRIGGAITEQQVGNSLTGSVLGLRGQTGKLNYELFAGWPINKPQYFKTPNVTYGMSASYGF